jgi:hypothetical protein
MKSKRHLTMKEPEDIPMHMRAQGGPCRMFRMTPVQRGDYPERSDMLVGYTVVPALWERLGSSESLRSADFSNCGETFCYLKLDGINGLAGSAFADKSEIEDALDEALRSVKVGCVIGGGTGLRYSYVDFAITDVPIACGIIRKILCSGKIPRRSWIMFFDSDRKDEWIGVWDETPVPPKY